MFATCAEILYEWSVFLWFQIWKQAKEKIDLSLLQSHPRHGKVDYKTA